MSVVSSSLHRAAGLLFHGRTFCNPPLDTARSGLALCLSCAALSLAPCMGQEAWAFQRSGAGPTSAHNNVTYGDPTSVAATGSIADVEADPGQLTPSLDGRVAPEIAHRLRHKTCTFDPYPTTANTVTVDALRIPDNAEAEYQEACEAYGANNLQKAEQHLKKAIHAYPGYAPGWVTLGKVQMLSQQLDEAGTACAQAANLDPASWKAAICLSEVASRQHKWIQSLAQSDRAMQLSPDSRTFGLFLDAIALLHLDEDPLAEQRALEAARLDREHRQPMLQLILAEIYANEGDGADEATELREFLKYVKDSPDVDHAKQELARLEADGH
jgi:predicted Zn-dependent protease